MLNPVTIVGATQAVFTQVPSGGSSVTILAANGSRIGAIITNTDDQILHLRLDGGTATTANYSVAVAISGGSYEVPYAYHGLITGIWAGTPGAGNANVTEFTA